MSTAPASPLIMDAQLEFFRAKGVEVSLFLSNGIRLNGKILKFDSSAILLTSENDFEEGVATSRSMVATVMRRSANKHQHTPEKESSKNR